LGQLRAGVKVIDSATIISVSAMRLEKLVESAEMQKPRLKHGAAGKLVSGQG
jgi:hypothetical protein